MIILDCCCGNPFPPELEGCVFNYPIVMINLIWAIVVFFVFLVLGIKIIGFLNKRCDTKQEEAEAARKHEIDLKEKAFEKEKFWHFQKELSHDFKKELNDKISELEEKLQSEKSSREDKLKQERLQMEHDYYKKLLDDFYNKENK